jgi:hypothetical protein
MTDFHSRYQKVNETCALRISKLSQFLNEALASLLAWGLLLGDSNLHLSYSCLEGSG